MVNEEDFLRSTSPGLSSETETSVAGQQCWRRLYREEASLPEGRCTVRESSRSDQRISEAIVRCDYGCFGTLGSQSARALVCSFRVELLLELNEPGVRLAGHPGARKAGRWDQGDRVEPRPYRCPRA